MKTIAISVLLFFVFCITAQAQADSEQLTKLASLLQLRIAAEMPGWIHRAIEPIDGSKNVIIVHWESGDIAIKIAATQYDTQQEAAQALKNFRSQLRIQEEATSANRQKEFHLLKEELPNLGDEAFTWDIKGSEAVTFRKGKFLVHISIARPEHSNDTYFAQKLAKHVVSAIDAL